MSKKESLQANYMVCFARNESVLESGASVDLHYLSSGLGEESQVLARRFSLDSFRWIQLPEGVTYESVVGVYIVDDPACNPYKTEGRRRCFTRRVGEREVLERDRKLSLGFLESQESAAAKNEEGPFDYPLIAGRDLPGYSSTEKNRKVAILGSTNFESIRYSSVFVDKTLFIKALLEGASTPQERELVTVITRPRRMGKTSIVEMVRAFFSKEVHGKETRPLFEGLDIFKSQKYRDMQGSHPAIFVTFKDVDADNFEEMFYQIQEQIKNAYIEHLCQPNSLALKEEFKGYESAVRRFIDASVEYNRKGKVAIKTALRDLTRYLSTTCKKKVVVLIDEYDTPLLKGADYHFLEEVSRFIHGMFKPLFKGNSYLYKGLITGILRISHANIFSSLNNVIHFSVLSHEYAPYFGFTEEEVREMLPKVGLASRMEYLKLRYGCYTTGGVNIYNPWSIICDLMGQKDGWIRSSNNFLITKLLRQYGAKLKDYFSDFLLGKSVICNSLLSDSYYHFLNQVGLEGSMAGEDPSIRSVVLSFLLHCGYLTGSRLQGVGRGGRAYKIQIPNLEILSFFSGIESVTYFQLPEKVALESKAFMSQMEERLKRLNDEYMHDAPSAQEKANDERESSDSNHSSQGRTDSPSTSRGMGILDIKTLRKIASAGGGPKAVFRYLAENDYSWSRILRETLYQKDLSSSELDERKNVLAYLIESRARIDETFFMQAVERIFDELGLRDAHQMYSYSVIREIAGRRSGLHYYSINVEKKLFGGRLSQLMFKLNVLFSEGPDLYSGVDLSIEVEVPSLDDRGLDAQRSNLFERSIERVRREVSEGLPEAERECLAVSNLDVRMALQAVVVHYFNQFGYNAFGMTSVMSRASNVYVKDSLTSPDLLQFKKMSPEDEKFLYDQALKKAESRKKQLGLADYLLSMREYYSSNYELWSEFCNSLKRNFPNNVRPSDFKSWMQGGIDLANKWYEDREREISQKVLSLEPSSDFSFDASSMPKKEDKNNYARGELYVLSLLQLAKVGKNIFDAGLAFWVKNISILLEKLREIEEAIGAFEGVIASAPMESRELLSKSLKDLKHKRYETLSSLRDKKIKYLGKIQARAKGEVDLYEKKIEARFRAPGIYPSLDSACDTVYGVKAQSDSLEIECHEAVGFICQQLSSYLLDIKASRDSDLPEGEVLCRLANRGRGIADVLYGFSDNWFKRKASFWSGVNSSQDNALLRRSQEGLEKLVGDFPDRKTLKFILSRDVKLALENNGVEYPDRLEGYHTLALIEYYKFIYGEDFKIQGFHFREKIEKEFRGFLFNQEPQILINLMRDAIKLYLKADLVCAEGEDHNEVEVEAPGQTLNIP